MTVRRQVGRRRLQAVGQRLGLARRRTRAGGAAGQPAAAAGGGRTAASNSVNEAPSSGCSRRLSSSTRPGKASLPPSGTASTERGARVGSAERCLQHRGLPAAASGVVEQAGRLAAQCLVGRLGLAGPGREHLLAGQQQCASPAPVRRRAAGQHALAGGRAAAAPRPVRTAPRPAWSGGRAGRPWRRGPGTPSGAGSAAAGSRELTSWKWCARAADENVRVSSARSGSRPTGRWKTVVSRPLVTVDRGGLAAVQHARTAAAEHLALECRPAAPRKPCPRAWRRTGRRPRSGCRG